MISLSEDRCRVAVGLGWRNPHALPQKKKRLPPLPYRNTPGYVRACHERKWTLSLWRKDERPIQDDGRRWKNTAYKCASWRHQGACADHRAAQDVERIKDALAARPGHYVYLVLTFARESFDGNFARAYRGILSCWDRMRKRLARDWGRCDYVCVVERHADGWPHINILIRNETLAAACAGDGWKRVRARWLQPEAKACGFGMRTWIEPMRSEAIATYLVKLSGEMGKRSQVPLDAPHHFRRLRGSRGFLPPRPKDPNLTGRLTRQEVEYVERFGGSPLPVCSPAGHVERIEDRHRHEGLDPWVEYCEVVEPEPGCREVRLIRTREVLWISYSFGSARGSPQVSDSGPPGGCADAAPAFSDSDAASARQLDWLLDSPAGSDWDGIYHGEA